MKGIKKYLKDNLGIILALVAVVVVLVIAGFFTIRKITNVEV